MHEVVRANVLDLAASWLLTWHREARGSLPGRAPPGIGLWVH
jgi:hypothetical protein